MKTKIIIGSLVGFLVIFGLYLLKTNQTSYKHKEQRVKTVTGGENNKSQDKGKNKGLSLLDYLKRNSKSSLKCSLTYNNQKVTFYFKNNLLRLDGIKSQTNSQMGSMIQTKDKVYIWNNQEKKGVIFPIEDNQKGESSTQNQAINVHQLLENMNQQKYQCQLVKLSDDYFQPPKDVHFLDLSKLNH